MIKNLLLFPLLISISFTSFGQWEWTINFEDPDVFDRIFIDTTANPNNIWQIGEPAKYLFNSAYSPTHVIITDSVNPYPVNDTSGFVITHVRYGGEGLANILLLLDFYFKMDSDTLTDFGMIEMSVDNGNSWINLMTDDTLNIINWYQPKPALTGTIHQWTHFSADLSGYTYYLGYSDTLLYKFTFISDGNQTNREGWMIDDFLFEDEWEGIKEHRYDNMITVSPNPVSYHLSIIKKRDGHNETVEVTDLHGQVILKIPHFKGEPIDIRSLKPGMYLLKYSDAEIMAVRRFVVIH